VNLREPGRDQYLSCTTLCLTVSKARWQMTAESMNDMTSIKGTARKLPDVLPTLSPLSTERPTVAMGGLRT